MGIPVQVDVLSLDPDVVFSSDEEEEPGEAVLHFLPVVSGTRG